ERVPDGIEKILDTPSDTLEEIVERTVAVQGAVVTGRGMALSTALETALKLKETCYLHTMGMSYADFLHGPIAVADPRTPALLVASPQGPILQGMVELAGRLRSAGAPVFAIGGGTALASAVDLSLPAPDVPEWLSPMHLIVPAPPVPVPVPRASRGTGPAASSAGVFEGGAAFGGAARTAMCAVGRVGTSGSHSRDEGQPCARAEMMEEHDPG